MRRITSRFARLVVVAAVLLGASAVVAPAQAAPGGAVCTAHGVATPASTAIDLACSGADALAGPWHLDLSPGGSVTGVAPEGGTVNGSYTRYCTVYVGVFINVCYTISVTVCVNGNCYTVTIIVCIRFSAEVCISAATTSGTGEGTMAYQDGPDDPVGDILKPVDPLLCPVLVTLAPTVDGIAPEVLYVDPSSGDTQVLNAPFWDCPPYDA